MKKIVIIERLTIFNLLLVYFYKFFAEKIYYREVAKNLKKEWFEKLLTNLGLSCLTYSGVNTRYLFNAFDIRKDLEIKFLKERIENNNQYLSFLRKYEINSDKFKLCIRGELQDSHHVIDGQSLSLIIKYKFLDKKKVYYWPDRISSYLLLKNYHKNLKVSSLLIFLDIFYMISSKIFFQIVNRFKSRLSSKKTKQKIINKFINLKDFNTAFFPHVGLKYGNAYVKNHFYNNVKNSKLNNKNLITIFRQPPDPFSKRFLSFWNMPSILIKDYKKKINPIMIINFCKKISFREIFSCYNLILFFFISRTITKIENNLELFKNLPNLKIIFCDFDVIFDSSILIACDIKKIKTLAIQERYAMNTLIRPLFFNYYFIAGPKFEPFFKDYGYIVDKYFPIGTTKTSLIRNKRKLSMQSEYLRLSKIKKKKILFIGTMVMDKFYIMMEGESGASIQNNTSLITELINLSKRFRDFHFILRFKSYSRLELLPPEILSEINNSENIELDPDEKINIYDLLSLCDLAVGRQSTLIEECISDEIPAIVFDETNFFTNYNTYPLNKLILIAKNSRELNMYFDRFYEGRSLYSPQTKQEINKYILKNKNDLDFKSKLHNILEEII